MDLLGMLLILFWVVSFYFEKKENKRLRSSYNRLLDRTRKHLNPSEVADWEL